MESKTIIEVGYQGEHDAVLNTLLVKHSEQPLALLTTVIDYLSQQDGVESQILEIMGAMKKMMKEAVPSKATLTVEQEEQIDHIKYLTAQKYINQK